MVSEAYFKGSENSDMEFSLTLPTSQSEIPQNTNNMYISLGPGLVEDAFW